ncbi:MAG TPA: sugar phosphate isomerase/epimerase family protein [Candidatus Brocadiia bacterium]|nr:sugar phosphate isomerase/epimerase family protein [Candidatus Brocadiia bacterium]
MIPTLFSVSYAGLWGQDSLDLPSFIQKSAELGFRAVELMGKRPHLSILGTSSEDVSTIRKTAEACGIEIATIAGYTNFTAGKESAEVPLVEMQVAYVAALSRLGRDLGARIVRIFTGYTTDEKACHADWTRCVSAVRECAEAAADYGVILGVQNHHDIGVSYKSYMEFLSDVDHPNCRAMFDPWSIALQGEDLYECAREMAPYMAQTTLADYIRLKRYAYMPGLVNYRQLEDMVRAVPLGDGFIDHQGFMAGLKEGGFDGYVAYEMCSPLRGGGSMANLDACAARSLKVLQELI